MSAVSYQQVLDATAGVELHHFRGTSVVVCCLTSAEGRVVLGVGSRKQGQPFDLSAVAADARIAANNELAKQLATPDEASAPADANPQDVAERSC